MVQEAITSQYTKMIYLPPKESRILKQNNRSNLFGSLWASFGLDLQSNLGRIRVSPRMKIAESSATEANMGLPVAFRYFDDRVFTIAGSRVFHTSADFLPNTTYTEDAGASGKTSYDARWSDMEVFNNKLYATTNDELMGKVSAGSGTGAWNEVDAAFANETTPHMLCYFKKYDRLYYNDLDFIASIDTAEAISSGSYEIDLTNSWREAIKVMRATSDSIFIGTLAPGNNKGDFRGSVYEWDGISSVITRQYKLETPGVMAMCVKDNIPYIIDAEGALLRYTGTSFEEVDRLPRTNVLPYNLNTDDNDQWIHPNGMTVTPEGTIMVLINNVRGDNGATILENMPSGVWEWSEATGFVHKMALTYTSDTTITDYGQNRVSAVGALQYMNNYTTSASRNGKYLAGATIYTNSSSTVHAVFYDDSNNTLIKSGYLVSSWIQADAIQDTWQKVVAFYKKLLASTSRVYLKYRTTEVTPTEITLTWTTTTTFTTTTDVSTLVGYEVEVIQGTGSGRCAHITTVTGSGTYTVTIDEAIEGVSSTAKARIQNWTKYMTVVADQTSEYKIFGASQSFTAPRVQFKCVMLFTGDDELFELAIVNKEHTKML